MRDYLATPLPSVKLPCSAVEFVALDIETTGLNPATDSILSVGMVHVRQLAVQLDTAWHQIIHVERQIPETSAIIHHITDDESAQGIALEHALPHLLEQLKGRVMLVHHAALEQSFLNAACKRLYNAPFIAATVDTQALARRRYLRRNQPIRSNDLRLFNLRDRYRLPRYKAHNALSDAVATAELFLAFVADMTTATNCRLADLLVR